jgi:ABC-2 type transport system ATP-binding protein
MLIIDNITVCYGKRDVLKGLSLSLEAGTIQGLSAINGSGKTTLMNTIYGFLRPSEGSISFNGMSVQRKDIAYLEADNYFYPYMTGRDYLGLFPKSDLFDADEWAHTFAIPLDDVTENYSSGMKKKLAIGATFQVAKPIMLLDEPFNGLDSQSVDILYQRLHHMRELGTIVLLTAHVRVQLQACCSRIHHLQDGCIAND